MASVTSLDKDLRNLRLGKYTPQVADEVRSWIEEALEEPLPVGDLLQSLKDGVALCKYAHFRQTSPASSTWADTCSRLVNLASGGPGVRYKQSSMPFVQMENISHFLRVCQSSPLNLQPHDLFQTVDLYEAKDPAQVLQCIGAFSRRAHAVQPSIFKTAIGGKSKGVMSPQSTGGNIGGHGNFSRARGSSGTDNILPAMPNSGAPKSASPARSPEPSVSTPVNGGLATSPSAGVSSWSKRTDEAATTPAWNIHQYGYMGGASQGNQGISFGGRRQITTPGPTVPSLAEKERRRREADVESERLRVQAEEERKRQIDREAEEKRSKEYEEGCRQQTRLREEQDEAHADDERREREEVEIRWEKHKESQPARAERSSASIDEGVDAKTRKETEQRSGGRDARLRGQFLSQYQAEQRKLPPIPGSQDFPLTAERRRIQELEQELERARQNEKAKQLESATKHDGPEQHLSRNGYQASSSPKMDDSPGSFSHDPLETSGSKPRPLPQLPPASHEEDDDEPWHATERDYLRHEWASHQQNAQSALVIDSPPSSQVQSKPSRPLPTPQTFAPSLPVRPLPVPQESPSRAIPKFPANPSSLLAREMERERIRQQEWEEAQKATSLAATKRLKDGEAGGVAGITSGDGGWDVNQYGYLGGDNQNRGGPGLGFGARRQIIGPRVEMRKG